MNPNPTLPAGVSIAEWRTVLELELAEAEKAIIDSEEQISQARLLILQAQRQSGHKYRRFEETGQLTLAAMNQLLLELIEQRDQIKAKLVGIENLAPSRNRHNQDIRL